MTSLAAWKLLSLALITELVCSLSSFAQQQVHVPPYSGNQKDPATSKLEELLRSREQSCQSGLALNHLSSAADNAKMSTCAGQFDGFKCWPSVSAGSNLSLPCPSEVFAASRAREYPTEKAKRQCLAGGRWKSTNEGVGSATDFHSLTDYSGCPVRNASLARSLYELMRLTRVSNQTQQLRVRLERHICNKMRQSDAPSDQSDGPSCRSVFDGVLCWPPVPAGTVGRQPCPDFLNEVHRDQFATRLCLANRMWHLGGWTNFTECLTEDAAADAASATAVDNAADSRAVAKRHLAIMSKIGLVGHSLSLATLLIAIAILAGFRRLHCRRNLIHINLYSAFGLRAISHFVNRASFENSQTILCRLNQSLMTFTVIGSFTWVFVEALHLYMLIFVSVMVNGRLSTVTYLGIGWGLTCLVTAVWVLLRLLFDNTECWREYRPLGPDIWLLNVYLALLVVINAILFAKIVREIFIKLKRQSPTDAPTVQPYVKLWKSTCLLVLVFGIYYLIFLPVAMVPKDKLGETLDIVHLYYEHFFNSFQGFFAAVLFCFVNSEVRHEVRRQASKLRLAAWLADGNRPRMPCRGKNNNNNGSHGNINNSGSPTQHVDTWSRQRSARRRGHEERRRQQLAAETCGRQRQRELQDTQEHGEIIPLQTMQGAPALHDDGSESQNLLIQSA